ncbi:altronate dehydratase [Caballeronia turbans]|nr:altronate dehydratase [Caballeronia turbans]
MRHGGTAIVSETPEIYGAEHLLTRRAISREVGEKIVERIHWWEGYAEREKGSIDNNPTPGNKAGGLTTILQKSLGAVAKSGSTPLMGVYRYAEPIEMHGLVFMDAPGYDPIGRDRPGRKRRQSRAFHDGTRFVLGFLRRIVRHLADALIDFALDLLADPFHLIFIHGLSPNLPAARRRNTQRKGHAFSDPRTTVQAEKNPY